ncbi:MAG: alpha/beta hydrolase [Stagnimonas sp.]|nr:alpha/beta hydrolase [Stagnimonas sp.]
MRFSIALLLAVFIVPMSACASHIGKPTSPPPVAVETTFTVKTDVVYTPKDWPQVLKANIYLPDMAGPLPAVLLIHGGGWAAPDRRKDMHSIAARLAKRGYVVVNATYRFAPQYTYPAPVDDLREALKSMHKHAAALKIDPNRVAAMGYSAGGHLAAMLGVLDGPPEVRVQAVVDGAGPSDLRKFEEGTLVSEFLGGTQAQVPQQFIDASPVTHVSKDDPPFFFYHGTLDLLVPDDHSRDFKAALDAVGVHTEWFKQHGLGHVTAFVNDGAAIDAALEFLDRELRSDPR